MSVFYNTSARRLRRGYPIRAAVGANGSGKSACSVFDLLPSLDAGRPVVSTVRLLDWRNPRPCDDPSCSCDKLDELRHRAAHPSYVRWTGWADLIDIEHADFFADEVTGVASGRDWSAMPSAVVRVLVQLRRRDVTFTWTAPSWAMADSVLKRCSQAVTLCRGYLPVEGVDSRGEERSWRNRRLFRWSTYDAMLLDDFEAGKRDKLTRLADAWHWGPGSDVFDAYDTFDAVDMVAFPNSSGPCERCGGRQQPRACDCAEYVASRPARAPRTRNGSPGARFALDVIDGSPHG